MGKRLIVLAIALASTAGSAAAQPAKQTPKPAKVAKTAPKPPALAKADADRLKKALDTGAETEVLGALGEIRTLGPTALPLAPAVDALLVRGSSATVIASACETSGALASESSSSALAPYVRHRSPEIRQAAARALVQTKGPIAVTTLRQALGSHDPAVRGIAAGGLGKLGAKDSVDVLFAVLGHDTPEAALSIAMLCAPAQCDRLMGLVGKLKFETLEPAFVPLLVRPVNELPEENLLAYIDKLRRLATASATAVLTTALASLPEDASPKVRRALDAGSKGRPAPKDSP